MYGLLLGVLEKLTWHRASFTSSYPLTIFAADAFHSRVRDGSEWGHIAIDTRNFIESYILILIFRSSRAQKAA